MLRVQKEPFSYQKQSLKNGYRFLSHLHQRNLIRLRIEASENVVLRVRDKPTSVDAQPPHSPASVAATCGFNKSETNALRLPFGSHAHALQSCNIESPAQYCGRFLGPR